MSRINWADRLREFQENEALKLNADRAAALMRVLKGRGIRVDIYHGDLLWAQPAEKLTDLDRQMIRELRAPIHAHLLLERLMTSRG